ncbi:WXG100 family type VII secretion target [Lentzea sp. HUAS12]|uniref:WXG100 family type VII secretion target n=1 Tax=Lentzea sp. HUAS12 TaxID=2951806 RepID=UPI0020A034A4|nr:WXG100 family type VII secretion target [Lentzea sp. HUAS12]USX49720.1 WXG100 family type VII secretion target [Lentzea sp. HUAS12]
MVEQKTNAGGVEITVGEKTTGRKMAEAVPFVGNYLKTSEAVGKFSDGVDGSEVTGLVSEGAAVLGALGTSAYGIATDPIGWLVGQGLNFLISVVQPLEDAIHLVSGDGPALQQAAENFNNIAKGVADMRAKFDQDLQSAIQTWGGQTSEVAATKLGEFANGIDGIAGQAGELARMLQISSMIMTIVEDFIKAILTELITWLVMIWIPALAAAVPSFGASTAAAGAATGVRVATTGSRVARIVARLRQFLDKIVAFLRNLGGRFKNVETTLKKSMADKRTNVAFADLTKEISKKNPAEGLPGVPVPAVAKLWGSDGGMIGERVASGFPKAMGKAAFDAVRGQFGVGTGANAGVDKPIRNIGSYQKSTEYEDTGTDHSRQRIEGDLDL